MLKIYHQHLIQQHVMFDKLKFENIITIDYF